MSARAYSATPLPETPDHHGAYPRLDDEQVARLAAVGRTRPTTTGEILFREAPKADAAEASTEEEYAAKATVDNAVAASAAAAKSLVVTRMKSSLCSVLS